MRMCSRRESHEGIAGYEEGRRLKNITTWLLSNAVQNSLPHFGLVPTYQNASVRLVTARCGKPVSAH